MTTRYTMQSAPMVNTIGLVRAAIATANTDGPYWVRVFSEGYNMPVADAEALVHGKVTPEYDYKAGTVTFEV